MKLLSAYLYSSYKQSINVFSFFLLSLLGYRETNENKSKSQ